MTLQAALPIYPARAQHDHGPVSTYLVLVTVVRANSGPHPTRVKTLLDWTPEQAAYFDAQLRTKPGAYAFSIPGVRTDYSYRYEYTTPEYGHQYFDVDVTVVQPAVDPATGYGVPGGSLVVYERDYDTIDPRVPGRNARMQVRWDLPRLRGFTVHDWRSVAKLVEAQEEGEEVTVDYHVPGAHGDSWWETGHVDESSPVVVRVRRASDGCPLRVYEVVRRKGGVK